MDPNPYFVLSAQPAKIHGEQIYPPNQSPVKSDAASQSLLKALKKEKAKQITLQRMHDEEVDKYKKHIQELEKQMAKMMDNILESQQDCGKTKLKLTSLRTELTKTKDQLHNSEKTNMEVYNTKHTW